MRAAYVFVLAAGLGLAAFARDTLDIWVNATVPPPLQVETSVEVLDRNGALLRAYTVADGRWRLGVDLSQVDPSYIGALLAYEDKRFFSHHGVDPLALEVPRDRLPPDRHQGRRRQWHHCAGWVERRHGPDRGRRGRYAASGRGGCGCRPKPGHCVRCH